MGNEYLAQTLMAENIATLNGYGVKKIVVTCPHCLQSLGKEYKQFGGDYEVVHHSTFLQGVDQRGKAERFPRSGRRRSHSMIRVISGRYNDEYDAPRDLLNSIYGVRQVEMPRSQRSQFLLRGRRRQHVDGGTGGKTREQRTDRRGARTFNPT